ncbi:chaperone protein dnaJ 20, chloroplastic-like [Curcuma longa]|uniref:chaperone protein dnaJ 20, chloroplastic-like n=1 Tax=Curcuma longa TaxID=136217 RepID=UPI003D9E6B09
MAALALSCPSNSLYRSSFAPIPSKSTVTAARRLRVSAFAAAPAPESMYDLLSVSHAAGPSEIRAAYRRQALRWHPDACRSAGEERRYAERFMLAREAYEVLSDPVSRRDYDLSLSGDRWAGAVSAAPAFRDGAARHRRRGDGVVGFGFGNWEAQLDVLQRRSAVAETAGEETWGGRIRRAQRFGS